MPLWHEANVPVRMSSDGTPHPPSDWAMEPHILELGVMAAWMLLNNSHGELVVCVCHYSGKSYTFKADSFLGLCELVVHVSGLNVLEQPDASTWLESSDLRLDPVLDSMAGLCTSTLSAMPINKDAGLSPKTAYNLVPCLINGLPDDLTAEQRARAEGCIKAQSNAFFCS